MPAALRLPAAAAVALALALAGCGGDDDDSGADERSEVTTAPAEAEGRDVPLEVVEGRGGAVLAFAPVLIEDEGPFLFALDTGASQSVVDRRIVGELGLDVVGSAGPITGVTGQVEAELVRVDEWRIGDVELDPARITTVELPDPRGREGLQGLLGSDVLSNFGAIAVDYESEKLVLTPRE